MIDTSILEDVVEQFSYGELVLLCEMAGVAVASSWSATRLATALLEYCNDGGELLAEQNQELANDFLYVAYGDDDEEATKEDSAKTLDEFMEEHNIAQVPDCWSYADDEDPQCKKCVLRNYCAVARIEALPPCFGTKYDENNEECKGCIEAPFCKAEMKKE